MVPNEYPLIATPDGGVIGESGITYDQNGSATGQIASLPVQSFTGNDYRYGSVEQVLFAPIIFASTFAAFQGGSPAQSKTYIQSLGKRYRDQVASIAKSDIGNSTNWLDSNNGGTTTCNLFVRDVLIATSTAILPSIPYPVRPNLSWYQRNYTHPFLAADWANPSTPGAGCWKPLPAGPDGAQPGDVIATGFPANGNDGTGHVGIIVVPNAGFPNYITASAADVAPYFWTPVQQSGFLKGTITLTDYGFRVPGFDPNQPDVQGFKGGFTR